MVTRDIYRRKTSRTLVLHTSASPDHNLNSSHTLPFSLLIQHFPVKKILSSNIRMSDDKWPMIAGIGAAVAAAAAVGSMITSAIQVGQQSSEVSRFQAKESANQRNMNRVIDIRCRTEIFNSCKRKFWRLKPSFQQWKRGLETGLMRHPRRMIQLGCRSKSQTYNLSSTKLKTEHEVWRKPKRTNSMTPSLPEYPKASKTFWHRWKNSISELPRYFTPNLYNNNPTYQANRDVEPTTKIQV
jgi:hypothetical protein